MIKPAPKRVEPAKKSTVEIVDVIQGSSEWHEAKLGIPSASRFADLMAGGEGKMRTRYLRELAGEIITGRPAETYKGGAMQRGNDLEAEGRDIYARTQFGVTQVGFVKNAGLMKYAIAGASPDALVGDDGGLEVKTMMPALMIELLEKGAAGFPSEHRAQVQGCMWVCERGWWDLSVYYPGMPRCVFRVQREDAFIRELSDEVERFSYDLKKLVEKIRAMK